MKVDMNKMEFTFSQHRVRRQSLRELFIIERDAAVFQEDAQGFQHALVDGGNQKKACLTMKLSRAQGFLC